MWHYSATTEPYDTDEMAREFLLQFSGQAFTEGQLLVFKFLDKKILSLTVKSLEGNFFYKFYFIFNEISFHRVTWFAFWIAADLSAIKAGKDPKPKKTKMGRCLGDTVVQFEKPESSPLNLTGKSKG